MNDYTGVSWMRWLLSPCGAPWRLTARVHKVVQSSGLSAARKIKLCRVASTGRSAWPYLVEQDHTIPTPGRFLPRPRPHSHLHPVVCCPAGLILLLASRAADVEKSSALARDNAGGLQSVCQVCGGVRGNKT